MPEVAEVALTAQALDKSFGGRTLTAIKWLSGRYLKTKPKLVNLPSKLKKVDSHGKFMWMEFTGNQFIFNTFGLTGRWSYDLGPYSRVEFIFGKKSVYFDDMRNFGTFKRVDNKEVLEKKIESLGPDFLKDDFSLGQLSDGSAKYNKSIVALLMDQGTLGSGIGNYLVAEILYMAKISPWRKGSSLTKAEIKRLENSIKYMTKLSYLSKGSPYMDEALEEVNKLNYHPEINLKNKHFHFQVYRQKTDPKGNEVKADTIVKGRTTYWVPAIQK